MEVIGLGCPTGRKRGIPIRLPPKNICDVNPWVCRMTPADFTSMQGKEPAVSKMTFEPQPRGCNCCLERLAPPKNSDSEDDEELNKPTKKLFGKKKKDSTKRKKQNKKIDPAIRRKRQQEEYERVRLLREKKRRCDFVTACCQGLMTTPCGSIESCSEKNEEKEQANFFIHADCAPKVKESEEAKPCKQVAKTKKPRADFPCQCKTCKYVKQTTDSRTGCRASITGEKTVCYCTEEDKCQTDGEPEPAPCNNRPVESPQGCNVAMCVEDCGQQAGKVLFTAALTREMLIQQARNGVEMANCIPTNMQYCLQCQRLPCAPIVQPCAPMVQPCTPAVQPCNQTATNCCSTQVDCKKVAEIDSPPDLKCSAYNCQQTQTRVKCTTMPDCTKIYDLDLDCQPDVTYRLNNCDSQCSKMPQYQQSVCRDGVFLDRGSSNQLNRPLTQRSHQGSLQGARRPYSGTPCGHICIPKGAVPPCAGDMSSSKFLIPLTFHSCMPPKDSATPCVEKSRRWPSGRQERMSSVQGMQTYGSSRKASDQTVPSRLSDARTSSQNHVWSNETFTRRSSPIVTPRNSSGNYNVSADAATRDMKGNCRLYRDAYNKTKTVRRDNPGRRSKQSDPKMKERPKSRSPSPIDVFKSKSSNKTKDVTKTPGKTKSGQRPSSPPHFEDVAPGRRAIHGSNDYEAALLDAMENVRKRYLDKNQDTTTGSSSARSTDATESCVTPTHQEFMRLTEQIKGLRNELQKYWRSKC